MAEGGSGSLAEDDIDRYQGDQHQDRPEDRFLIPGARPFVVQFGQAHHKVFQFALRRAGVKKLKPTATKTASKKLHRAQYI